MLGTKAKEVAEDAGIPVGSFPASNSWKKRFLVKYHMSLRHKTHSAGVASNFQLSVLKTIEQEGIVEIYNADETAINYEYLPMRTYNTKVTRMVRIRNADAEKKGLTVMFLGDMHGNRQTPFAIFKQPPSRKPETKIYNRINPNGFGRGG
ncbi:hypothetical protein PHMEG_00025164 [Phytophthora megakarya]|uniref:HTH CENPB-type domain-containing protein n=1 Tax=Phytophthora megakarya TaxID=4795 RepID=A0A225VCN7_9STRA|nr:hypothetical protein PHMEG_00025164 [Phytophthora megakarya]